MPRPLSPSARMPRWSRYGGALLAGAVLTVTVVATTSSDAAAATSDVGLGTAGAWSVLGGQTVTNTGPSRLDADLGVSPGTAITGFPPGQTAGATHAGDADAAQAQSDVGIAYDDAASRAPTAAVAGDLVGRTLVAGVYNSSGPLGLTGTVTLDGQGDPNAVFVFQVASTLITASASTVALVNDAQACHVYWQVASSATLGTFSAFSGTVMALASVSVMNGTTVAGRAFARTGQVSLENNVFTQPECRTTSTTPPGGGTTPPGGGTTTPPGGGTTPPGGGTTPPGGGTTAPGGGTTAPGGGTGPGGGTTAPGGGGGTGPGDGSTAPGGGTALTTGPVGGGGNGGGGGGNGGGGYGNTQGALATTGASHVAGLVGGGGALVLGGLVMILISRRRKVVPRH